MSNFKFKDTSLKLTIEDKDYTLRDIYDIELMEKMKSVNERLVEFSKREEMTKEAQDQLFEIITELVDTLLGDGSTASIFENVKFTLGTAVQLIVFLKDEVSKAKANQAIEQYFGNSVI